MNPGDLDWGGLHAIAQQVDFWPRTAQGDIIPRIQGAEVIILNKCRVDEALLAASPSLRWIGVTGTGTDMIDIDACRRHNVAVANVPGYSTESVAQHTFALLLELTNATGQRSQTVRDGHWQVDVPASYGIQNHTELWGKTFGVVGYGAIGKAAARIANGFGMKVLAYARTLRDEYKADGVEFVPLNELLQRCDIISLHCPATPETNKMIGPAELAQMKQGAILLNTARGALIDEEAVAKFAKNGHILYVPFYFYILKKQYIKIEWDI